MQYKNNIFLDTINHIPTTRPPVWLMRQAGRILPQYRALRAKLSGFKELVETPNLAAEVTIQPIDELGVDAAIIFSDILVIPEAMGLSYEMVEKIGPRFPKTIQSKNDIDKLISGSEAADRLQYVYKALTITKAELNNRVPLIGFSGAPWTLFAYMIEGGGSKTFSKARKFLYTEPELSHHLLQKLTDTIIAYLKIKVNSGADLIQIFDSWAGILPAEQYKVFSAPYIDQICNALSDHTPITVFAKNAWYAFPTFNKMKCDVIGVDWNTSPQFARRQIDQNKILQGNLDPCLLYSAPKNIESSVIKMINEFDNKHIVNLGHGVYPDTPLTHVKAMVNAVKKFSY